MRHAVHLLLFFFEHRVLIVGLRVRRRHLLFLFLYVELSEVRLNVVHLSGILLVAVLVRTEYGVSAFPWVLLHVDRVLRYAVEIGQFWRVHSEHLL